MLTLIGLGLNDEHDLTLRGVEAAKEAEKVYYEFYTGKWGGSIENLQKVLGQEQVFPLKRQDLEEDSMKILEEAKSKNIAILVQGDPLVATTHSSLLVDARNSGIETRIIHNSSIFSAIAETGLHVYKFGSTVTIPFLEKIGKFSKSVYDSMKENKKNGLHTLCLLDVGMDAETFMTPEKAMSLLMSMERQFGEGVIEPYQKIVVFSKAGGESKVFYGEIEELNSKKIDLTPSVLIIPGKMHFTEEEFLEKFGSK